MRIQAHKFDQFLDLAAARRPVEIAGQAQGLLDDAFHGVAWVERRQGILDDGLDALAQRTSSV
jgi:hypothetical protein